MRQDVTYGYKEITENGVKYFGGQTDQGECYKDLEAWKNGSGVIYISEYTLIDLDNGTASEEDLWTRESWLKWVKDDFAFYGNEYPDEFAEHIAQCVLEMCDWQDLTTLYSEINIEECYEYWKEKHA